MSEARIMTRAALFFCAVISQLFPISGAAEGLSLEAACTAHTEGRYLEAASLAETLGTSAGCALAAESLALYGHYVAGEEEEQALFQRAMLLAQKAIRLDPLNAEAYLQSAHAMGRYAQTIGAMEALSEGYATKVHEALQNALRLNPAMGSAHLSLGAWHSEIVAALGGLGDSMVYGATRKDAIAHYERALELEPEEILVPVEYALGLLRLDETKNRERARGLLARALHMPSKHALDRILHQRAVEILAALDARTSERDDPPSR